MLKKMDFTNKVVIVTGASAGIGEATAILFAKKSAKLALVGRNPEALNNVAQRCEKEKGFKALPIVADISTDEGCEKIAKETLEHFGRLDVLVNNAAMGARTTIQQTDMELYDRVLNTNLRAVYNLTRLLVPALIETKGCIVNVSSVMATMVTKGNLPYSVSKAALDHFSRLVAYELAPKGVRVNVASPGLTRSTFVQRMTSYTPEEYEAWLQSSAQMIPMGRVCTGDDCAELIVLLAGDQCSLLTGAVIPLDGALRFTGSATSEMYRGQV